VAPRHLRRAELRRANLDRDRGKESVTLLEFHQPTKRPDSPMLYIVLVHDDPRSGAELLERYFYRHTHCTHAETSGLALRFKRARRRRKELRLVHSVIVDCGVTVGGHERVDRLIRRREKLKLKRGKVVKRWEINRALLAE